MNKLFKKLELGFTLLQDHGSTNAMYEDSITTMPTSFGTRTQPRACIMVSTHLNYLCMLEFTSREIATIQTSILMDEVTKPTSSPLLTFREKTTHPAKSTKACAIWQQEKITATYGAIRVVPGLHSVNLETIFTARFSYGGSRYTRNKPRTTAWYTMYIARSFEMRKHTGENQSGKTVQG